MFEGKQLGQLRFVQGLCCGLFVGLISVITIIKTDTDAELFLELENYVFAIVALLAAIFSLFGIQKQIMNQIELNSEERARKNRGLVASFPLQLDGAINRSKKIFLWYLQPNADFDFDLLNIHEEVDFLARYVESCDKKTGDYILTCLSISQVLITRLRDDVEKARKEDLLEDRVSTHNFDSNALNWSIYTIILIDLLETARGKKESISYTHPPKDRVERFLDFAWLRDGVVTQEPKSVSRIKTLIAQREKSGSITPSWMDELRYR